MGKPSFFIFNAQFGSRVRKSDSGNRLRWVLAAMASILAVSLSACEDGKPAQEVQPQLVDDEDTGDGGIDTFPDAPVRPDGVNPPGAGPLPGSGGNGGEPPSGDEEDRVPRGGNAGGGTPGYPGGGTRPPVNPGGGGPLAPEDAVTEREILELFTRPQVSEKLTHREYFRAGKKLSTTRLSNGWDVYLDKNTGRPEILNMGGFGLEVSTRLTGVQNRSSFLRVKRVLTASPQPKSTLALVQRCFERARLSRELGGLGSRTSAGAGMVTAEWMESWARDLAGDFSRLTPEDTERYIENKIQESLQD